MKKRNLIYVILIVVSLLVALSGCKKENPKTDGPAGEQAGSVENEKENNKETDRDKLMKEFDNLMEKEQDPGKIKSYIDENISNLTNIEGDQMVAGLEKVLEDNLDDLTDRILELDQEYELINLAGDKLFFPGERIEEIENDQLREEVKKALENKYKLINLEGAYYPMIDYEGFKEYEESISPELKDYMDIKALDSQEPVAMDAALNISHEELGERLLKTEDYIERYAGGLRYEEMLRMYRNKLTLYLDGADNSPIYDYETNIIYEDVLKSYEKMASKEEGVTGFITRRYINLIEDNDYIIDRSIEDNVLSLVNESLALLETSK